MTIMLLILIGIAFLTFSEEKHISFNVPVATKKEIANKRPTFEDYKGQRNSFILSEEHHFLGANLTLTDDEQTVNKYIMRLKQQELAEGFNDSYNFIPARHYFEMLDRFDNSKLFRIIRRLPKGGVLHAHSTALGSVELIVNATYRENLWQNGEFGKIPGPKFKFSKEKPGDGWSLVSEIRKRMTDKVYDANVNELFSLYNADPLNAYKSLDNVWEKFQNLFVCLKPLITYEPVWRQYYRDSLQQFYDDHVHYLEFRGSLPAVYDLEGKIYSREEIVQMYYDDTELFKQTHPKFIGVKLIYAPARFMNDAGLQKILQTTRQLHSKFPRFLAGFDLVGQEDPGRALFEFAPALLELPKSINFFFHAGETNWFGMKTDENLIDAVLLGSKRIGHGFAALKHPNVLKEIKHRQICIEINPISNQILKLVQDQRNHPAALLFSDNYPVVVSSDDPSFWRATPLSHDFYVAFIGIASARQDLRLLKQLALNSIEYSAMNRQEKIEAQDKWNRAWREDIHLLALDIAAGELQ
ncbi:adenosine deaminase 2-like [Ochlerotatus camptorhynchus]|uniref:adenosine deaminase 2-like n=1 Tax=Ochlerotatus camptorhynchus TaxID=644619 RepID=UPI0031E12805